MDPHLEVRDSPTGLKPYLKGTGLAAWEVHMIWKSQGRDMKRIVKGFEVPQFPWTVETGSRDSLLERRWADVAQ